MYSQTEIDEAVAAGAISAETAQALRAHVQQRRDLPIQDEEQFRLITGFNDIFVSIAAAILLFAVGWIGQSIGQALGMTVDGRDSPSALAPLLVAATAWGLALFFTARRRMALPSILLLLAFVAGVFGTAAIGLIQIIGTSFFEDNEAAIAVLVAASAAIAAGGAWLHWGRFRVPITIAAGAAALVATVLGLIAYAVGDTTNAEDIMLGFILLLGVGVFLFAMWWDSSDRARVTRRSDVAFWLHLLAAPMIVHPVFTLLGLNDGTAALWEGLVVILLYVAIGLTALAIDRRALLVSALAYVLWALTDLFERFGAVELSVALTALIIGSALLLLSAFWTQARTAVVRPLPERLQARLPMLNRASVSPQPAA